MWIHGNFNKYIENSDFVFSNFVWFSKEKESALYGLRNIKVNMGNITLFGIIK